MTRARRSYAEKLVDTLKSMAASAPNGTVSSNALEAQLKWGLAGRFAKIRKELVDNGTICAFPGGGGGRLALPTSPAKASKVATPAPAALAKPAPVKVFVSYAHADAKLKNELIKHLDPMRRLGLVAHWHDGDISAGQEWERAIMTHLKAADLVVLLITVDFLASDYCYDKELKATLDRRGPRRPKIIPVIGRNCIWQDLPFAMGQAVNKGQALESQPNLDEALTEAAKEIRKVVDEIQADRLKPT